MTRVVKQGHKDLLANKHWQVWESALSDIGSCYDKEDVLTEMEIIFFNNMKTLTDRQGKMFTPSTKQWNWLIEIQRKCNGV